MIKKRGKKAFWKNIRFKYKLSIVNENTLEEIWNLRVSKLNGGSVLFFTLLTIFSITASIIAFTPLKNYLPGYMNSQMRTQIVTNALQVDSLQHLVDKQNNYISNIIAIFNGDIKADSVHSLDTLSQMRSDELIARSDAENKFRVSFEEDEKYTLSNLRERELEGLNFYIPVKGKISSSFENRTKNRFGVQIAAKANEPILSIQDGTVVLCARTIESGYIIQIQHEKEFLSTYKGCAVLFKKEGDKVKLGEAIALVGDFKESGQTPHLYFELWHKGVAINPETYIYF